MKAIALLAAAPISTIHGFCGMLIRDHGFELGIDPSFTILDEQRSLDFAREAARDTIREQIRSGDEDVEQLFGDFGLDSLVDAIVSAGYWMNSLGVDEKWLDGRIEDQRAAANIIENRLAGDIRKYGGDFKKIGELADELEARKARHPLRKHDDPAAGSSSDRANRRCYCCRAIVAAGKALCGALSRQKTIREYDGLR
jgi:ATP-dependent exoDNAse (exonuclease V) beta subunit